MAFPLGGEEARTGNDSLVDGIAYSGVGGACAFGSHVALGCISGHDVIFRCLLGKDHAPGNRFLDSLQILCAGMEEEVYVGINQARHQGGWAEIDDLSASRMFDAGSDCANAIAFDKNLGGLQQIACIHLEKACGVQHDR